MNPTYDPTTGQTTPTPRYTKRAKMAVAGLCALTAASLAGVLGLALTNHDSPAAASTPAAHTTTHTPAGPAHTVVVVHPSAAIAQLQKELAALNYYNGPIDGLDGPLTQQAITYLQRDAGLPQTGVMNSATEAALHNFLIHGNSQMNPAPDPQPIPSATVTTLQKELGQLNYYEGPVNGLANTQTTQAITYFQRDAGLPQTGVMNSATQAALQNFLIHGNNQMGA